jgi:hypothetical protein
MPSGRFRFVAALRPAMLAVQRPATKPLHTTGYTAMGMKRWQVGRDLPCSFAAIASIRSGNHGPCALGGLPWGVGGNKAGCVSPMKPMLPIVRRQLPGFGASFGASFGPGAYWLQKAVA